MVLTFQGNNEHLINLFFQQEMHFDFDFDSQIFRKIPSSIVLACAPSNSAADLIVGILIFATSAFRWTHQPLNPNNQLSGGLTPIIEHFFVKCNNALKYMT